MRGASAQMRLDLSSVSAGVARFGSGDRAEYCAVLEVAGMQQSLARVDEAKQEEILAAYAQFLNALNFPFQLVVQARPVDLGWYVTRVEERARGLSAGLVAVARDHAGFVQSLTRQRTLLERRLYVVVPWSGPRPPGSGGLLQQLRHLSQRVRGGREASDEHWFTEDAVSRQLSDRCDEIARQLARAGLRATRLDDLGLARLYHASWSPDASRSQRLRRELSEYTALVVGADVRSAQGPTQHAPERAGSPIERSGRPVA
jgi:CubicO group peptidase (beta-lactamase class C family)